MVSTRLQMVTAANPTLNMLANAEHGRNRRPGVENRVDQANLLTAREQQVLSLVAEGFSNKSIAVAGPGLACACPSPSAPSKATSQIL